MNDVIERLEAVAENGYADDWLDVLCRAERQRSAGLRRRVLLAAVAACLLAVPALALAYRFTDVLVVANERAEPPTAWIADDRLHNLGGVAERRLGAPVWADDGLHFRNKPFAVPSPDERLLLYRATDPPGSFLRLATPVLRLHELETGRDRIFEYAAGTLAWRADGALAYAKGLRRRPRVFSGSPVGHVYVRASIDAAPVRWTTTPARYTVLRWARDSLLVGAIAAGQATPAKGEGVYALSAPGEARKLPIGDVIALDPSGELAFGPIALEPVFAGSLTFRVVRVDDGEVLDELDLPAVIAPDAPYAAAHSMTGGSWADEFVVVSLASEGLEAPDALVLLRFDGEELTPAHVFRLEPTSAAAAGFGREPRDFFHSPRFLDDEAKEIVVWAPVTEREGRRTTIASIFLHCHRVEKRCRRTDPLPGTRFDSGAPRLPTTVPPARTFVENPSRPLPEP
jgi:hypothetical protein